jgi:predicted peptidase
VAAGDVLPYLEFLPPGYAGSDVESPLLIFLHGSGEYGDGSEDQLQKVLYLGIPAMIANGTWPAGRPFVVLMPQYHFAQGNGVCDVGDDLERFIGNALSAYRIDPRRVYLTGISCGAIAIFDYLSEERDYPIAAAVPISGHPGYVIEKAGCSLVQTPIWEFHGALDEIVPIDWLSGFMDELASCTDPAPADLTFTVYPEGHHDVDTWDVTYDLSAGNDIYTWMLGHRSHR